MSLNKGTRWHYVDKDEYDKTWKERLIYWGDRLRNKVYHQKDEILALKERIAALEAQVAIVDKLFANEIDPNIQIALVRREQWFPTTPPQEQGE